MLTVTNTDSNRKSKYCKMRVNGVRLLNGNCLIPNSQRWTWRIKTVLLRRVGRWKLGIRRVIITQIYCWRASFTQSCDTIGLRYDRSLWKRGISRAFTCTENVRDHTASLIYRNDDKRQLTGVLCVLLYGCPDHLNTHLRGAMSAHCKVEAVQRWVCGGDAALCQITLDTCYQHHRRRHY